MDRVTPDLRRGEVWEAEFDPVRGREQAGRRPALIVSADQFHQGQSQLTYVLPLTRTNRGIPWHVAIEPPEGGTSARSFIMCDQMRVFALEQFLRRRGSVGEQTMAKVEYFIRLLLAL